jgi:preprotein translocase subunit SecE
MLGLEADKGSQDIGDTGGRSGARAAMPKDAEVMALYNPLQFLQEVRQEVSKVTWPSRKEVWITTVAVLIMVSLAALFFLLVDQALGWLVSLVLGFGR